MNNYNLVTCGGGYSLRLPKGGQRRGEVTPHRLSDLSGGDS